MAFLFLYYKMHMIRIGLFGIGHLGKIHLKILKGLPQYFNIVGIHDIDRNAGLAVQEAFNVPYFEHADELIQVVDALDVVTPTPFHFDLAYKAIQQNKHVFIEKPVTQTLQESTILLELATRSNSLIQVGHVERFNPAFIAAQPLLHQPDFIETHRLAQFNPRGTDVPVVLDLMIHDLDIILHVVQSPVKHISASGVAVVSESHDITNARIEFENGTVANLTASRISLKNMRKSRFFQRDAYVGIDFLNKSIEVVRLESIEGPADPYDMVLDLGNGKPPKKLSIDSPKVFPTNAIEEELKEFAMGIRKEAKISVDLKAGHEALKVAYQILDLIQ